MTIARQLAVGACVEITGLVSRPELNGCVGVVVRVLGAERVEVRLATNELTIFKEDGRTQLDEVQVRLMLLRRSAETRSSWRRVPTLRASAGLDPSTSG